MIICSCNSIAGNFEWQMQLTIIHILGESFTKVSNGQIVNECFLQCTLCLLEDLALFYHNDPYPPHTLYIQFQKKMTMHSEKTCRSVDP